MIFGAMLHQTHHSKFQNLCNLNPTSLSGCGSLISLVLFVGFAEKSDMELSNTGLSFILRLPLLDSNKMQTRKRWPCAEWATVSQQCDSSHCFSVWFESRAIVGKFVGVSVLVI